MQIFISLDLSLHYCDITSVAFYIIDDVFVALQLGCVEMFKTIVGSYVFLNSDVDFHLGATHFHNVAVINRLLAPDAVRPGTPDSVSSLGSSASASAKSRQQSRPYSQQGAAVYTTAGSTSFMQYTQGERHHAFTSRHARLVLNMYNIRDLEFSSSDLFHLVILQICS